MFEFSSFKNKIHKSAAYTYLFRRVCACTAPSTINNVKFEQIEWPRRCRWHQTEKVRQLFLPEEMKIALGPFLGPFPGSFLGLSYTFAYTRITNWSVKWCDRWHFMVFLAVGFVNADVGPSESECRPYIEKAINELKTGKRIKTINLIKVLHS